MFQECSSPTASPGLRAWGRCRMQPVHGSPRCAVRPPSGVGRSVDAHIDDARLMPVAPAARRSAHRHAVVLSEHAIDVAPVFEHAAHQLLSARLGPVAVHATDEVYAGKRFSASQNPRWRSMANDDVLGKPVIFHHVATPFGRRAHISPITRPISWLSAPMKAVYLCESVLRSKSITGCPCRKRD